ncbi:DgaE family pyridoxal phosphate-dependent ammonia lyase [Listeria rocourtiae]|uniref:DgaE family pyridoxal phosphate-dependent ammonia lyase n=1 Tax=Listeria rocourtiae TaxID=647910 RepID=UPI00162394E9|nr:DgaE family pyridoxal phosphate-dependent ammonia lyase [Listeria rocourtiae]MBC1436589.1 DgaE family pyridoxal phosphate-dependent ammonia lyase [Listeria rocourtiae]
MTNLNEKYGLKRVINASGRMSILGVSAPSDTVFEAMKQGGQNYVEIADLVDKAGARIAEMVESEDAAVVNSASSGIALSVAAMVTKGRVGISMRLHQEAITTNEIILLKGHNVQYGAPIETMIALGGGRRIEVGYANEGRKNHVIDAINERTAALLYVQSHHAVQKNMLSVEEMREISLAHNIPLIIDAAAEGDLKKYVQLGDLAIYSGSKAIEGPTTGIVAGGKEYVSWVKTQLHGIGRSMKVGKESTFGLLAALEEYWNKADTSAIQKQVVQKLAADLANDAGITVTEVQDEAGRPIFRARIQIDAQQVGKSAVELVQALRSGPIAIYTRDYGATQGFFDIDSRSLQGDDAAVIAAEIKRFIV